MTTAEQDLTPNPDYLDVLAEDAAVAAINNARDAIGFLETFDKRARTVGQGGVSTARAIADLEEAKTAIQFAIVRAVEAGNLQADANKARQ